jgi:cell division transport system permease protein
MLSLNIRRILKAGMQNFSRNTFVSLSAVLIMTITLIVFSTMLFTSALLNQSLVEIKKKVDINVYFLTSAEEASVLSVKTALEKLPEVEKVEYVSREQALENFKYRHRNESDITEALFELEDNPLGAILNIKAKESQQYEGIAKYLDANYPVKQDGSIVEDVNFNANKEIIDKLTDFIAAGQKLGGVITLLFIFLSIIITFNTIRLAMYISRDEIKVMRLVGATSSYISGPFIVTGVLYGIVSSLLTLILLYPTTWWAGPVTARFFNGINVLEYYMSHFGQFFLIIFFSSIFIGAVSSFIAVKRYLREARKRG